MRRPVPYDFGGNHLPNTSIRSSGTPVDVSTRCDAANASRGIVQVAPTRLSTIIFCRCRSGTARGRRGQACRCHDAVGKDVAPGPLPATYFYGFRRTDRVDFDEREPKIALLQPSVHRPWRRPSDIGNLVQITRSRSARRWVLPRNRAQLPSGEPSCLTWIRVMAGSSPCNGCGRTTVNSLPIASGDRKSAIRAGDVRTNGDEREPAGQRRCTAPRATVAIVALWSAVQATPVWPRRPTSKAAMS